jgi:glutamate--cysteine ligase
MIELAREVLTIANAGLKARSIPSFNSKFPDETHFLDELKEVVETKRTAADKLIDLYTANWRGDISKVFDQHSY